MAKKNTHQDVGARDVRVARPVHGVHLHAAAQAPAQLPAGADGAARDQLRHLVAHAPHRQAHLVHALPHCIMIMIIAPQLSCT